MRLKGGGGRDDRKGGPLLQQEPKTQQLEEIAYARRIIGIVTQNRVPVANSSPPPPHPPASTPFGRFFFGRGIHDSSSIGRTWRVVHHHASI